MSKFGESILRACADFSTRRPWLVLLFAAVLTALSAWASLSLTVDTSTDDVLASYLPFRQAEMNYVSKFPEDELAAVVVDAADAEDADAAARLLAGLMEQSPNFEFVTLAGDSPYFDRYGLMFLSPAEITEIGEQLRPTRRILTSLSEDPSLRGIASLMGLAEQGVAESAAPAGLGNLLTQIAGTVSEQAESRPGEMRWNALFDVGSDQLGTRRIIQAKPVLDNTSLDRAEPALDDLRAAIDTTKASFTDATIRVTGEPVLRQQELNDAFSGAALASGLSFILVALSLVVGVRSGRLILALIITLVIGSVLTTGLAAVTVGRLNLISVAFLVLFFGLGVDFGTHLGLRHLEEAKSGKPFREALMASMLGEGPAIVLSAVCAALAFLAFVPTSYVGLAEFGIISALGMLVAVVVTFTLQPALMALMPPKPKPSRGFTIGIGAWIERWHRAVLVVAALVTAGSIYFAFFAEIDTNPLNLQNPNTEAVETYRDLARDPDTSPYGLDVLAPNLEEAAPLRERLEALPGVSGVRTITDFVPADQDAKLQAIAGVRERMGESFFADVVQKAPPTDAELSEAFAAIRASAEAIGATPADNPVDPSIPAAGRQLSQALATFAEKRGTEPAGLQALGTALTAEVPVLTSGLKAKLSVNEPVTIDDIPEDMRSEWIAADGEVRLHVLPEGDIGTVQQMREFNRTIQTVAPDPAGAPASVTGAGEAILSSFAEAIIYTVLSIGILVAIVRRSISDVILVLAPLGVAALWTVAASALMDMPFNFANIIVIPLLIGLGVAGSIHIVARTHEVVTDSTGAHEEGMHVLDTSTPLAVLVAQLNTVAAFATLAVADHRGLFSMGVLLGVAIMLVLIVSLVVLPSFMIAIGMGAKKAAPVPPAA